MEKLFEQFTRQLRNFQPSETIKRYLYSRIEWNNRLIAIKGAPGIGKTTLILQYISENFKVNEQVLLISLDNIYFAHNSLYEVTDKFVTNGGKYLFIDNVHKYHEWKTELKKIFDKHRELKIVLLGTSITDFDSLTSEFGNYVKIYELFGLSFREYIEIYRGIKLPVIKINDLLERHLELSQQISSMIMPLTNFSDYLRYGYYPFFSENISNSRQKVADRVNSSLETDLPYTQNVEFKNIQKIKKLLYIITNSSPMRPNVSSLSEKTGATRGTVMQYLDYLKNCQILNLLKSEGDESIMAKPEKIYLSNTNLIFSLTYNSIDLQNVRETFFYSQLIVDNSVTYTPENDFYVNKQYIFDISGKERNPTIMGGSPNIFLAVDDIETGFKNKIPLWLFGFLY